LRSIAAAALLAAATTASAADPPFRAGERLAFRITYLHLLAGRAWLSVEAGGESDAATLRFIEEAKSEGFFAWLFHFRVNDRAAAEWDPETGCSWGIEKHLREGRASREQVIRFDPESGVATVRDPKIDATRFEVEPCVLDVLSALYVARIRGVSEAEPLYLPVFDNGKHYRLGVRFVRRDVLDLPAPLGRGVPTVVVEPQLIEGTGLFVKKGRLRLWLTDDGRRIPVRMQSKVPVGSVSADLESCELGP
jgi:Protein of unknown function (DUF3108)